MKSLLVCTLLVFSLSFHVSAQRSPGRGGVNTSRSRTTTPDLGPISVFVFGKVTLDDGTELSEPAAIQTICKGQKRTQTYTDSHGSFSFELGNRTNPAPASAVDMDGGSISGLRPSRNTQMDWQDCELQASLTGFSSDVVQLGAKISSGETNDVGRVTLHRLAHVEGAIISATTAQAPAPARKAWEKGRNQTKDNKLEQAQKSFEKAVEIYPRFAAAWCDLGRAQLRSSNLEGARHSFEQSVAADPKYVGPYGGLAQIALIQRNWQAAADATNKLLALDPVSFVEAWYFNASANFYLENFDAAEKSVRQGLKLDQDHHLVKLEYLLGLVLFRKHQYQDAAAHMRQYLRLTDQPTEIAQTQKQLTEIERASATATASAQAK